MIHVFDSEQTGAPTLSGTAGALLAVLRACLVDGFGTTAVASASVAGGVLTLNFSGTHPFKRMSVLGLSGATNAAFNGKHKVLTVSGSVVTCAAPEGASDGPVAGSLSAKLAPAGWAMPFYEAANHKGVFARSVPEATDMVLRVDDSGTTTARVRGFEDMTDIDAGLGPFPTDAQVSGGLYWGKSNVANATARRWAVVACERWAFVYVVPQANYQETNGVLHGFGDPLAQSVDAYACVIAGASTAADATTTGTNSPATGCFGQGTAGTGATCRYFPRSSQGTGGSVAARTVGGFGGGNAYSGTASYSGYTVPYPNGPDAGLYVSDVVLLADEGVRAQVPGVRHTPQVLVDAFVMGQLVDIAGRVHMALRVAPPVQVTAANRGTVFIDVQGPWREVA